MDDYVYTSSCVPLTSSGIIPIPTNSMNTFSGLRCVLKRNPFTSLLIIGELPLDFCQQKQSRLGSPAILSLSLGVRTVAKQSVKMSQWKEQTSEPNQGINNFCICSSVFFFWGGGSMNAKFTASLFKVLSCLFDSSSTKTDYTLEKLTY